MKRRIVLIVLGAHLAVLTVFIFSKPKTTTTALQSIRVSTFTYEPPPPKKQVVATIPLKKTPVVAKKAPTKKPPPPKLKPKPKPTPRASDVLAEVKKNLQKIDRASTEKKVEAKTVAYATILMQRLQSSLNLPEEGNVKLELELRADGKVMGVKILQTHSEINAHYLEEILPTLFLPSFVGDLQGQKQHTFTLTVCHDN
ncbi:MAG: hypothetical protein H7A40_04280 [Chlamydiales bacterium]|nr:hypothetical protein [Chlamydiales bacterium]